jgi:hypothetical protein
LVFLKSFGFAGTDNVPTLDCVKVEPDDEDGSLEVKKELSDVSNQSKHFYGFTITEISDGVTNQQSDFCIEEQSTYDLRLNSKNYFSTIAQPFFFSIEYETLQDLTLIELHEQYDNTKVVSSYSAMPAPSLTEEIIIKNEPLEDVIMPTATGKYV